MSADLTARPDQPSPVAAPASPAPAPLHGRLTALPHIAGVALAVYATAIALWSISPTLRFWIHAPREYLDEYYLDAPDTSLSFALVVALLAGATAGRKRVAWWILTIYFGGFAITNLLFSITDRDLHHAGALVVHLALIALLLLAYPEFYTRVRRGAVWKSLAVLIAGLVAGTLLGWGLVELFPGSLPPADRFLWAFNRVTTLTFIDNDQFGGRPYGLVNTVLGLLGALALLAALLVLFRTQRSENALTGSDESAIRGLLDHAGSDSLAYFATRRDKAVVFAPSGKAAITYRVEVSVCLASGDPIGDPEAWSHAIDEWLLLADAYGWTPAVMGASEDGAVAYHRAGLSVLQLGDEAVLIPKEFGLAGRDMRPVRQAVSRARKHGVSVRILRHRELSPVAMAEVIRLADQWRDTETERGFSMALGRLGDPLDGDCLLVEAVADGTVVAMLSLVPWGEDGVSLDLMRRDPHAPNGVVELMVSELAAHAETFGITRISLNFAVFRAAFEEGSRIGAGPILRLWRSILLFFSRWWQLEALYRSNVKYRPQWVPRYLCFRENREIPRVGMASAIAEGFLPVPTFGRRNMRRHTGTQSSFPEDLPVSEGLHHDGSAPDPGTVALVHVDTPERDRPEQVRVRMDKLERIIEHGVDPYPVAEAPSHSVAAAKASPARTSAAVAGRVLRIRDFGGVLFAVLRDWSGDIQILVDRERVSGRRFLFDLGDLVEVAGVMGRSRSGEISLLADSWRINGKCLHPLPDKWHGLVDPEAKVRQRYVDLAVDRDARTLLAARSAVVRSLRDQLQLRGYLEVETPILQSVHGGANAAPFLTHINAYDADLYLRIAPELYLKRLCVAGMEKVFEIGRVFRNEGADFKHNPEFTILEAYEAHSDYEEMMVLARELVQHAAVAAHGREIVVRREPNGERVEIDISGQWPVKTFYDALSEALGTFVDAETPTSVLRRMCDEREIGYDLAWDAGATAQEMYEHLVESRTEFPTFYTDFPTSVSPLTRPHPRKRGVAAKWDLVAWGVELGTAYSELTDPIEQRARLTEQSRLAAGGDDEAMELDEDFLRALEHAMPPTGGLGMGVDRIVMLILGGSIRESLAFPFVKPRRH
ncbi:bifunctional lysylphosphatidylglycerol synthetase/lysine--tRNA ligase LysX [Rhodococcus chondri]|uniref:Lysine--tRNA ligase n=1 Tax=Rhodococcus chondri TaxID=3065941 RepID=A0ABU7JNU9_9NOCA|nr:bifunctional lysylphosphatidylglycerol synthetase/lysine--tRNA ligase LysX [Rhodococcus sp. CC-R104]MEE2031713.1 bifunctional lysylphosphatidylglycerol synthetase/lysine--tRNA ligase LysX [Rhodococcus sp. CC-R104]